MSRHHKKHSATPNKTVIYRGRQCQHAYQGCCRACTLGPRYIQRFETVNRRDGARQYQGVAPAINVTIRDTAGHIIATNESFAS